MLHKKENKQSENKLFPLGNRPQTVLELDENGFIFLPTGVKPRETNPYLTHKGLIIWSVIENLDEMLEEFDVPGALIFLKYDGNKKKRPRTGALDRPEKAKIVIYC